MKKTRVYEIKREQKKSRYFREISSLLLALSHDEPAVLDIFITRVELSADTGICFVYLATTKDKEYFDKAFERLKLYKRSMRANLAKNIKTRYVPDIFFKYDTKHEKELRVQQLLDTIQHDE